MIIIKPLLGLFVKNIVEESQKKILKSESVLQLGEGVRKEFLRTVAEGFTREVAHNLSQYVKSVGEMSVSIAAAGNDGERLFTALQTALKQLEVELEEQGPDSPVIAYLTRKYGERSDQALVGRPTRSVADMLGDKDAFADRPWLNRTLASPDATEFLSAEASRIFERLLADQV
jgi:hypothetical protein